MRYLFYILLGLLPSLIWLSFYLRKDKRPEPNSMVLKVFILGIFLAPIAVVLEILLIWILNPGYNPLSFLAEIPQDSILKIILAATLIPALVEEYLKYSVVKFKILKNSEFDEPTDAMIYCIIAGLGFATVENLLVLFKISFPSFGEIFSTIGFRFLGATLVHALSSAIIGYWVAKGLLNTKNRKKFIAIGLTIAIAFHSCYNYLIIHTFSRTDSGQKIFFLAVIAVFLISAGFLVSFYFKKLKRQQSICKLK